jgi:phosphoglycolate phosphatase
MQVIAAAWGYLGDGVPTDEWGADHVIERPAALLKLLAMP